MPHPEQSPGVPGPFRPAGRKGTPTSKPNVPQAPPRDFRKTRDSFIDSDSDGCLFDTREVEHKGCFIPNIIRPFGLAAVSKGTREAAEFVDLPRVGDAPATARPPRSTACSATRSTPARKTGRGSGSSEALPRSFASTYAGDYMAEQVARFERRLPEKPPWKTA